MAGKVDQSAEAIAVWLGSEFPRSTLEYKHLDTDYQIQGEGISKWELEEGKDVFLYRVRDGAAKYELAVTVFALEDFSIEHITGMLRAMGVGEMLRRNPGRRVKVDRTLIPTVLPEVR